jgi:hypothetical protein
VQDGPNAEADLGQAIRSLLSDASRRRCLGEEAAARSRRTTAPEVVYGAYEQAYRQAFEHLRRTRTRYGEGRRARRAWWLASQHLFPWSWKHAAMWLIALLRERHGYRPRSGVPIDAPPEEPAPRS